MKNFKIILAALFFSTQVFAVDTIVNTNKLKVGQKSSSANKILEFDINASAANPKIQVNPSTSKLQFTNDGTVFKDIGSGGGGGSGINLLTNGGFETGLADGWVNSGGTWAIVTSGTNLLYQLQSATFTASASGQYFETTATLVPEILKGRDCLAKITYKGGDTNEYLTVMDGLSAEIIPTTSRATLNSTAGIKDAKLYFTCPSSGSIKFRVQSTAAAVLASFDDATFGASDLSTSKQSQYLGSIKYIGAAGCSWSTTATSFTNYGLNASCNTASSTGVLLPPATKIPALIIPYAAKGTYFFSSTGKYQKGLGSDGSAYFRFSDGTNFSNSNGFRNNTSFSGAGTISGQITLTSDQTNWSVQVQGATDGTAQAFIEATSGSPLTDFEISVYFYPSGTDTVVNSKCANDISCENNFSMEISTANIGTGVNTENLDWISGNCSWGASVWTCNFNSGIFTQAPICTATLGFSPTSTGAVSINSISSSSITIQVVDNAVSVQKAFKLSCQKSGSDFKAKQNIQGFLASTVTSTNNSIRTEYAKFSGASINTPCTTTPCTIQNQSGAFTSVARSSTGQYTANFASGTFSAFPTCSYTGANNTTAVLVSAATGSLTTLSMGTYTSNTAALTDSYVDIICYGPR